jgi:alkylhydroperoxidase family enzyme
MARDVDRLMRDRGYDVTLRRNTSGGEYDVETGTMTGGEQLTWTGRGLFLDYSVEESRGTSIDVDDRKLILSAVNLERAPDKGDIVDDEVQIIRARRIQSRQGVIGYICQTRG